MRVRKWMFTKGRMVAKGGMVFIKGGVVFILLDKSIDCLSDRGIYCE